MLWVVVDKILFWVWIEEQGDDWGQETGFSSTTLKGTISVNVFIAI